MNGGETRTGDARAAETLAALADLMERLGRCGDLDDVLTTSLESLESLFHFRYSMFLMLDETETSLYTIASHGYDRAGIGSEVLIGEGIIGAVASQRRPMRIGNLRHMIGYGRAIQESTDPGNGTSDIALPGLPTAASQLAAPSMVTNRLLGVLAVESEKLGAFTTMDENLLTVVAHVIASAIELDRVAGGTGPGPDAAPNGLGAVDTRRAGDTPGRDSPLLSSRWQHLHRQRVPDQGRGRTDLVATVERSPGRWENRVHQSRGAA